MHSCFNQEERRYFANTRSRNALESSFCYKSFNISFTMIGIRIFVPLLLITMHVILQSVNSVSEECKDCRCCVNQSCVKGSESCTSGCKDGYYGNKCWIKCPEYCKRCGREFGYIFDPDTYQICYECADGYFNGTFITNCSSPCPLNCLDNVCDKHNGICTLGCKGNFTGWTCTQCKDGWYRADCSQKCSPNCKWGRCWQKYGVCRHGCKDGYFGDHCNTSCSVGCLNNTCERLEATCNKGCKVGYSGNLCCIKSKNCIKCASKSKCSACKVGYWGQHCDKQCSEQCLDNSCNMLEGNCFACKDGFHGHVCTDICSANCLETTCQQSDGKCINCSVGYFGTFCEKNCSMTCKNASCSQHAGECLIGCVQGYNGTQCEINTLLYHHGDQSSGMPVAAIGASVSVAMFIAVLVVVGIFCWKKRNPTLAEVMDTRVMFQQTDVDTTSVPDVTQNHEDATQNQHVYQNMHGCLDDPRRGSVSHQYEELDDARMDSEANYSVPYSGAGVKRDI